MKFKPGQMVRHIKTGNLYRIIMYCTIEKDCVPAYAYFGGRNANNPVWVRPVSEMEERFETVS